MDPDLFGHRGIRRKFSMGRDLLKSRVGDSGTSEVTRERMFRIITKYKAHKKCQVHIN